MKNPLRNIYRLILIVLILACGIFIYRTGLVEYLSDPDEIIYTLGLIGQHVKMVMVRLGLD